MEIDVFSKRVTLVKGQIRPDGRLGISALFGDGSAVANVAFYEPATGIAEADIPKLEALLLSCRSSGASFGLTLLIGLSDLAVGIINFISTFIRLFLSSFVASA